LELIEDRQYKSCLFLQIKIKKEVKMKKYYVDGDFCEAYEDFYGSNHKEYGGTLTDLRRVKDGVHIHVTNGDYDAQIVTDRHTGVKQIQVFGGTYELFELNDKINARYIEDLEEDKYEDFGCKEEENSIKDKRDKVFEQISNGKLSETLVQAACNVSSIDSNLSRRINKALEGREK
jgi:hypothetical protein